MDTVSAFRLRSGKIYAQACLSSGTPEGRHSCRKVPIQCLTIGNIRFILPASLNHFLHDVGHNVLRIFSRTETSVIAQLLSQLVGDSRSAAGEDDFITKSFRFNQLYHLGQLLDVDLGDLTQQLEAKAGVSILSYDLKLVYVCENCKKTINGKECE